MKAHTHFFMQSLLGIMLVMSVVASSYAAEGGKDVWVEIEFQSQTSEENYFIIGLMSKAVYDALVEPNPKYVYLRIHTCRYWNEETEQYAPFEDEEDTGEVTVAVKHVVQIVRKKGDPLPAQKNMLAPNDIP